jgi:uncharacterized protein (PEP-CTERM system associated)
MSLLHANSWVYSFTKISFLCISPCIAIQCNAQVGASLSSNISTTQVWSSNLSLDNGVEKSGWTSQISPGINFRSTVGRFKGYTNYSLNVTSYSTDKSASSLQNALNSAGSFEFIDGHGFVDVTGLITQQTISAFSVQSNNNSNLNSNKTEVSSYSIAPYFRGKLSSFLDYEVRHAWIGTQAKKSNGYSSNDNSNTFRINGSDFFGKLSWVLDASQQKVSRNIGSDTEVDALKISLNYPILNKIVLSVNAGRINQNYSSTEKIGSWTSGAGFNWPISEMTKLAANVENNPLGGMHSLNFEHRTPRTTWRVSDVKSVSLSNGKNTLSLGNNYDLLYNQFASIESDPIKRAQLVNNYLINNGISANSTSLIGYLTSGNSIVRAQSASFALLGVRDTIIFTAARSAATRIATSSVGGDDLSNSSSIRQDGLTVGYTHRLNEDTVLSHQFSKQKTSGDLNSQKSEVNSVNISASTRVGVKAYLTLSARRSISSSISFPYKESAITGNLSVQF